MKVLSRFNTTTQKISPDSKKNWSVVTKIQNSGDEMLFIYLTKNVPNLAEDSKINLSSLNCISFLEYLLTKSHQSGFSYMPSDQKNSLFSLISSDQKLSI
jgi:hypothetical protein